MRPERLVKKHDVERRTRRKTLNIFLCGFRGFCLVRGFFTRSKADATAHEAPLKRGPTYDTSSVVAPAVRRAPL